MAEVVEEIRRQQSEMGRDLKVIKTAVTTQPIAFQQFLKLIEGRGPLQAHSFAMSGYPYATSFVS